MISIVIVSHSAQIADGLKILAEQISQGKIKIYTAGGVDDNTIGTNVERIHKALQDAKNPEGVLVLLDLGSAVMSTEMAVEMLSKEDQALVRMSDAPLVEGTIIAAVEASLGNSLDEVKESAEATATMSKLSKG